MSGPDLSIVIPVYNNASTLDELIDRLLAVLEPMPGSFEIVFVDDDSRDASLSILQARAAREPRIRVFALVRNFGGQAAACAGLDLVRGRHVISMDADLENCPEDIPVFENLLERGYDLVNGYRETRGAPWLTRRLPSSLMNAYVRRKTGTRIRDVGCGMRGFQSWVVRDLEAEGEARRLLTPVFLRRAHKVTEVALRQGAPHTSSGHSFLSLLGIAVDYYVSAAGRPFLASGLLSAAAVAGGSALLLSGTPLAGLVIVASGLLGLLVSLLGEYCQRLYQLVQGVPFYQLRNLDGPEGTPQQRQRAELVGDARLSAPSRSDPP